MSTIENNVMATVRVIHFGRTLVGKTALECYALGASLVGIAAMVSVTNIEHNMALMAAGGLSSLATYVAVAVLKTNLLVQVALALGLLSLALLARDMARTLSSRQSAFAL